MGGGGDSLEIEPFDMRMSDTDYETTVYLYSGRDGRVCVGKNSLG